MHVYLYSSKYGKKKLFDLTNSLRPIYVLPLVERLVLLVSIIWQDFGQCKRTSRETCSCQISVAISRIENQGSCRARRFRIKERR